MTASQTNAESNSWVVIWTESRAEKQVERRLAERGIEPWLPKFTERRQWSDRWKDVVLPLFPGYLFARVGSAPLSALLRIPGVMTIVKHGDTPARLSNDFIAALRGAVECAGVDAAPLAEEILFNVQDEVVVSEGPLRGMRGFVREIRNHRRLVIWVQEIGRGVAFSIGSSCVQPVSAEA